LIFVLIAFNFSLPIPTKAQLEYQDAEIGVIIHFSSNTYGELQGCGEDTWNRVNDSNVFQPSELDIDSWLEAAAGFGAKYAVLTAKHQCGFCLWPTNVTIPLENPVRYNYSVAYSTWKQGQEDVIKTFVDSCKRYGIKPGLYYSANDNEFLKIAAGKKKNN